MLWEIKTNGISLNAVEVEKLSSVTQPTLRESLPNWREPEVTQPLVVWLTEAIRYTWLLPTEGPINIRDWKIIEEM